MTGSPGAPRRLTRLHKRSVVDRDARRLAAREAAAKRRTDRRKSPKRSRLPVELEAALQARAGHRCELCGLALAGRYQRHHRKLRSQGGLDHIANLVLLHPNCHNAAHQNPEWARKHGWIVSARGNPTTVPILLHNTRRVRLTSDGAYREAA